MLQRSIKAFWKLLDKVLKVQLLDKVQKNDQEQSNDQERSGTQGRRTLLPLPRTPPPEPPAPTTPPLKNMTGVAQNEDKIGVTGRNGSPSPRVYRGLGAKTKEIRTYSMIFHVDIVSQ